MLFLASFAYIAFVRMSPASAGFAGGLVVGYFLHVWEKLVTYERMLEERISAEAERQVSTEVDEQVGDIEREVEERVGEGVGDMDERIEERVEEIREEVEGEEDDEDTT
ncbi:MAG: hypothetical protein U5J64_04410 [Halobacteriales archaeon]|nr:hypothetical protein [Halobacteriales archaeon]